MGSGKERGGRREQRREQRKKNSFGTEGVNIRDKKRANLEMDLS